MRNEKIDLLRFIGLIMIIFAHVGYSGFFMQIRNFDVPLMVVVSGMSFSIGYKNESYIQYLWKRVKRLLFPVWIFLTIYFSTLLLVLPSAEALNPRTILRSYFLLDGIGYVWIIRVFILVALVSPPIYLINQKIRHDNTYLVILFLTLIVYEAFRLAAMPYIGEGILKSFSLIAFYIVPYAIIFALGLRLAEINYRKKLWTMMFSASIFFSLGLALWIHFGIFTPTQAYKYPPSLYYFSYAVSVSIFIWLISDKVWSIIEQLPIIKKFVLFVAQNSLWIYLWHIPFVKFIQTDFLVEYLIVITVSTIITIAQVWFVKNFLMPKFSNITVQKNLKILFTG